MNKGQYLVVIMAEAIHTLTLSRVKSAKSAIDRGSFLVAHRLATEVR
jgi:hypothetical protein